MRRREFIMAGGATAALLAGCLGDSDDNPGNSDDGNNSSNGSADNPSETTRTVTVTGAGEVVTEPDQASFSVRVEERGEDAEAVRSVVQERIDDIIAALIDAGVDEDDITTSGFRVSEDIRMRERREEEGEEDLEPVFVGIHNLDVEVHGIDDLGTIVDAAIDAGASRVSRISFELSDEKREDLRNDALEEAIEAGTEEAEFIAGRIDAEIVEVKKVGSTGTRTSRSYLETEDLDDAAGGTHFRPDDVSVSASVELVVRIE